MTHKVTVDVVSNYIEEQSLPEDLRFVFAYHITIKNQGQQAAKLLSRHWIITDGNEQVQEVKGPGVVGETPLLQPGESFQYSSGAILNTMVGTMQGRYQMISDDGTEFLAEIPPFTLAVPNQVH
ncbi:Co2+/Mg2+ efflux protein ApaG [Marinomonas algicola]|jgi:ApaG protein|uniref:Co2+/Mg2+ efflux protein ApaG n=1 Tax=Marinomonas algicola TaxID=2773454 RepID=UPI0017492B0B|nr:Co2+/Mg2+ efflux protein ApaG [Marinomonas algicola]